jgi:hypothetical protein
LALGSGRDAEQVLSDDLGEFVAADGGIDSERASGCGVRVVDQAEDEYSRTDRDPVSMCRCRG